MSLRAVYKDGEGKTYSCPVAIHNNRWMMQTSAGFEEIGYNFQDDVAGLLVFVEYREETDSRIHVQPGSTWADHKLAHAQQRLVEERKQRDQARAELNNQLPDPHKVQQAREINNQIAQTMRPRGKGQYLVNE